MNAQSLLLLIELQASLATASAMLQNRPSRAVLAAVSLPTNVVAALVVAAASAAWMRAALATTFGHGSRVVIWPEWLAVLRQRLLGTMLGSTPHRAQERSRSPSASADHSLQVTTLR